jgi:hypothetical protein
MKPQSRTLVLGSSCESIEILNESDLPWEPSNDDPTIGWRKFVRPWVVPQFGNVIMRRTFPTVFNFGSHCYIWMSSTSTKKKCILIPSYFHAPESKHEIKHCRPQEQNHVWDSIFSDLLEFPWKSHICPSNPPKNDALINGEIRNHLEQSILSRLSHFKRFSCQRGRIAQRSPRTRRAPQWQDSSLGYSGNFWDVHLPSTHLWFLWCFDLKFLAYSNGFWGSDISISFYFSKNLNWKMVNLFPSWKPFVTSKASWDSPRNQFFNPP